MTALPPDIPSAASVPEPPEFPSPTIVDSRRLMGPNLFSAAEGAVLEVRLDAGLDEDDVAARLRAWEQVVRAVASALAWPSLGTIVRRDEYAAQLFCDAPVNALMTATEVNEQAWVLAEQSVVSPDAFLLAHLRAIADAERALRPNVAAVHAAAKARGVTVTFDDETLSLGGGAGARTWLLAEVPPERDVPWSSLHDVPIALVTGSNGKTTTARLVAAMWRAAGCATGWCCSDGVWVDDTQLEAGDYSGPAGARAVLRDARVEAAVLETARGGILRRGLAVHRATAAIITNISADHFGEYGLHTLHDLAEAKAVLARALGAERPLVLNADDATLVALGAHLERSGPIELAWFSLRGDNALLAGHVEAGGDACTLRDHHALLHLNGTWHDLGDTRTMPLTLGGAAPHNVANILGASLLAGGLGIPVSCVRDTLHTFGAARTDNPGRLQVYRFGGVTALVDYAHNPDGIAALCATARTLPAQRRLLVIGQAGDRDDALLRALADAAWSVMPFDRVIIKEMVEMLRGRAAGEIPAVLRDELLRVGAQADAIDVAPSEFEAIRRAFAWSRDGDVLVCPVHADKKTALAWLARLGEAGWAPGLPLPD